MERGTRPTAPRQTEYQWVYLFGAVCPETGAVNGWIMPEANTEAFNIHLASISKQVGQGIHVMLLLDRAGWHGSKGVKCPANITLVPLPPYSPELNPAEQSWKAMRQESLSNRVFPQLDDLDDNVGSAWLALARHPERIKSMCAYPWIQNRILN